MASSKKVIIWATEVNSLVNGKPIGGIAVQMFFWANVFVDNGWMVYSFAENAKETKKEQGIFFMPKKNIQKINLLLEWWYSFYFLMTIRPRLIVFRGANRSLFPLSIMAKLFGVKLVMFGASDVNFEPGKELVGSDFNRKLYHRAIRHIHYFVTQNQHQHDTLLKNYGKDSLTMYNIWGEAPANELDIPPQSDAVWVANFRKLKRAEWVLAAAKQCKDYHFVMAGGGNDMYYRNVQKEAGEIENLDFLGPKSFFYTNSLIQKSKVLLCTSTFEGFPNTFLQAWSNGLPVISTVDPSGIIAENGLGEVVDNETELVAALVRVLEDEDYFKKLRASVSDFFQKHHASQSGYERLIEYIQI